MTVNRRTAILGGLGAGGAGLGALALSAGRRTEPAAARAATSSAVKAGSGDQTKALQQAIATSLLAGEAVSLPAGTYRVGTLTLPAGAQITGVPGRTILKALSGGPVVRADDADGVRLSGLVIDASGTRGGSENDGVVMASGCKRLVIADCHIIGGANGIVLQACAGAITGCEIEQVSGAGIFANDAGGLEIAHNHVHDCANNGILVWRTQVGEDRTRVSANRIARIKADAGGSGQNGNGINVFRADAVMVTGNDIADCAFSAIRFNSSSNAQILGNACARAREVAVYVEFAFSGAVVANNVIDDATVGISITNFKQGGRLATVQGNLVRNITRKARNQDIACGIAIEADTMVANNVVEGCEGIGIGAGWGEYLRDVTITSNLVRDARIGIGVSVSKGAGYAVITNNMVSGAKDGAIRALDHLKELGPDLAQQSAESYRNLAVFGNAGL